MMIQPETMQCLWFRELLPENDSYLACTLKWALLSLWKWVNVQEPPVFFKVIASSLFTMIIQCGSKGMSTWKTAWGFIIAHWLDFAQLDIFLFFIFLFWQEIHSWENFCLATTAFCVFLVKSEHLFWKLADGRWLRIYWISMAARQAMTAEISESLLRKKYL